MLPVAILFPTSLFIYGRAYDKTYDENTGYLLLTSELTSGILTFGTKMIVNRKRPLEALSHVYTKGMPALDVYSFPSGHTSTTFSIATMFALRYPKYPQIYAPMYAYALIVAYGRPYFGMHYPSDLLVGAIYGAGSSVLIYSLRKELFKFKNNLFNENQNDDGSINAGTLSFFVGSFIVSGIVTNYIIKPPPGKRLFVSPWVNNKGGGLNINWGF
jgi:undecaprenyl-diphosphatase